MAKFKEKKKKNQPTIISLFSSYEAILYKAFVLEKKEIPTYSLIKISLGFRGIQSFRQERLCHIHGVPVQVSAKLLQVIRL